MGIVKTNVMIPGSKTMASPPLMSPLKTVPVATMTKALACGAGRSGRVLSVVLLQLTLECLR